MVPRHPLSQAFDGCEFRAQYSEGLPYSSHGQSILLKRFQTISAPGTSDYDFLLSGFMFEGSADQAFEIGMLFITPGISLSPMKTCARYGRLPRHVFLSYEQTRGNCSLDSLVAEAAYSGT